MKVEYPKRLFHKTPSWVEDGSVFHIRIRCADTNTVLLTEKQSSHHLLESARFYQEKKRWFVHLFLLMPDHIHALLSFPKDKVMSEVVGDWKRYQSTQFCIQWQDNFFDHRIRNDKEYLEKAAYIRRNPGVKGLCSLTEDWPWLIEKGGA